MKKKAIVSVINDLVTDQRVHKSCQTLEKCGFEVLLIGRRLRSSPEMDKRSYQVHRMNLIFEKGPFFYAEFNIRLYLFLLFQKPHLLVSNDLDTLLPNYLISKISKTPLVYDSHEYFTEVPELVNRKSIQQVWKFIERNIFPKIKDVVTVNDSIADLFYNDYGIRPRVVRNIPRKSIERSHVSRKELQLPEDKKIIILQGSGINVDRGSEELVEAMQFVKNARLLIVGGGDVIETLKEMVEKYNLNEKVMFKPRMPYLELIKYTSIADLGITFDKSTNLNYRFSLPNKLFDYIQSGTPVLSSELPEIKKIITKYDVGDFIESYEPVKIADKINEILSNEPRLGNWKKNCSFAAQELTWENEEVVLKEIYGKYV